MTDAQMQKLFKLYDTHDMPNQMRYVLSVMLTELKDSMTNDRERIEREYGTCFTHYVENLTNDTSVS